MNLQQKIIQDYMEAFGCPTLRSIALDTGIHVTRVFRIIRGSRMKLDEYEIMKKKVDEKRGGHGLTKVVSEILDKLPARELSEIEAILRRRLKTFTLRKRRIREKKLFND